MLFTDRSAPAFSSSLRCRVSLLALIAGLAGAPALAAPDQRVTVDIAEKRLPDALLEASSQAGVSIAFPTDRINGLEAPKLTGTYTVDELLTKLLAGTGLKWQYVKGDTVRVYEPRRAEAQTAANDASPGGPARQQAGPIEDIIVTAQKVEERLQDVPVPVTVVNAQTLADNGISSLKEYAATVPGFAVVPSYEGNQYLSIRGIATGGTNNPTVAVLVDGVPVGASIGGAGNAIPDLDPYELARIEVLRGPQGTLYGASNMGGLINYVTKDPSTDGYSARVEAGTSSVYNGAEPGFDVRGSVNIPFDDTSAIRLSAFKRQDPGYIDNPVTFAKGVNRDNADGARLSGVWQPSDDFKARFSAVYQNIRSDGLSQSLVQPGLGDLQQNYMPGTGQWDRTIQAYNVTLNYKVGTFDLTSVTGYNVMRYSDVIDFTILDSALAQKYFGVTGAEFHDQGQNYHKFSEEFRVATPIGSSFDLLAGAFYTKERTWFYQTYTANNQVTGQLVGQLGYGTFPGAYEEYAAFADLTYHVTDQFDIQAGARESHNQVTNLPSTEIGVPSFGIATPITIPEVQSTANAFTYLLTPEYKFSPDFMVYARMASGYRPGGPNSQASVAQGAPAGFSPDKTYNYEVGTKGDFIDHMLTFDASIYYINWKNIQLKLDTQSNFGYAGNGGNAKSEGVEIALGAKPWEGMTASAWFTYDDAVITQPPPAPAAYLYSGEPLAYNPAYSANISLEQTFPLVNDVMGYVGGQVSYVGDRYAIFTGTGTTPAPRQLFPAYTRTDLHAGVRYDSWTVNLYANNVADVRGLIGGGLGFFPNYAFIYIQPRTVGVNVAKTF